RRILSHALNKWSYNTIEKVYATKIATYNIPWMIYKVERYCFQKLNHLIAKWHIKKLLRKQQ
ncbi:MAG: hypothetical protein J6U43_03960, partial [Bacteroidales bacterium]|nr:hypothetical protein [Bacteroidales bacterium]